MTGRNPSKPPLGRPLLGLTCYDGSGSLAPEPQLHDSTSYSSLREDDNGSVDRGTESGVGDNERHISGASVTPRNGPGILPPPFTV